MSAERPALNKESGASFIQLATSSRDHFSACTDVWSDFLLQPGQDLLPNVDTSSVQDIVRLSVEEKSSQRPNFRQAFEEVESAFAALSESYSGDVVDLMGVLKKDWRWKVWELAAWVEGFPEYQQAFDTIKKIKDIDRRHKDKFGDAHQADKPCLERDVLIQEVVRSGNARRVNEFQREFDATVAATLAIGLGKEQFVIESIERALRLSKPEETLASTV